MKTAVAKYYSIALLLVFICAKGLSYHPLAHVDDENHDSCDLCELVILNTVTPTLETEGVVIPENYSIPVFEPVIYTESGYLTTNSFSHHCRPPPVLS